MPATDQEILNSLRIVLSRFYEQVAKYRQAQGHQFATDSQADQEMKGFARTESLVTCTALAGQLIESSGEHVTAFVKTITEPMEPIACWTCVRSMMETSSIAAWLLDPKVDAKTRVGRTFALRYEGLDQHLKFCRTAKIAPTEIANEEKRMHSVEDTALTLGYPKLRGKDGKRTGIGQVMPSATEMIKMMLDEEISYRLLSAVAHGHHWAIVRLGFAPAHGPDINIGGVLAKPFQKAVNVEGIAWLAKISAKAFALPLWNQCLYNGWDKARLAGVLDTMANAIPVKKMECFWQKT